METRGEPGIPPLSIRMPGAGMETRGEPGIPPLSIPMPGAGMETRGEPGNSESAPPAPYGLSSPAQVSGDIRLLSPQGKQGHRGTRLIAAPLRTDHSNCWREGSTEPRLAAQDRDTPTSSNRL